ncbi:swr complex subunit, partial [Cladochytrium tenue]
EEEHLFMELKRRELNEKKWAAERDRLMRLFTNHEIPLPPPSQLPPAATQAGTESSKPKKSKKSDPHASADGISSSKSSDKKASKTRDDRGEPAAAPPPAESPFKRRDIPQGVYLRSSKFTQVKPAVQAKFKEITDEFGIPATPAMPTELVSDRFEQLRLNVIALLELKKLVDRQEHEIRSLEARKRILEKGGAVLMPGADGPAATSGGGGTSSTVPASDASAAGSSLALPGTPAGDGAFKKSKKRSGAHMTPSVTRDLKRPRAG